MLEKLRKAGRGAVKFSKKFPYTTGLMAGQVASTITYAAVTGEISQAMFITSPFYYFTLYVDLSNNVKKEIGKYIPKKVQRAVAEADFIRKNTKIY